MELLSSSLSPYGEILETYRGETDYSVILIEDLHSVAEAQESIYQLISSLQKDHGIACVALEGASGELDTEIFRSCPDQNRLFQIIRHHLRSGNLASSIASAILSWKQACFYYGAEDWDLYQQGLSLFAAAIRNEKVLLETVDRQQRQLQLEKQKNYSPQLLELDEALEAYYREEKSIISLLEQFTSVKEVPKDSAIRLLLRAERLQKSFQQIEVEVKRIARKMKEILETRNDPRQIARFTKFYQAYQISELSAVDFAILLEESFGLDQFPVKISNRLCRLMEGRKKWRAIRMYSFLQSFEGYVDEVFAAFLQSEPQRRLYQQSKRLRLLTQFARLQLCNEQWKELEKNQFADVGEKTAWQNHFAFYRNAAQRGVIFYQKLRRMMEEKNYREALVIVGGFHIGDLIQRLKQDGISYVLLLPRIDSFTKASRYREQMQGEVPWKAYLEPAGGRIHLFQSFVRFIRDQVSRGFHFQVLQSWGYRLFVDLSHKEQEGEFFKYFGFLSSAIVPDYSGPALLSPSSFVDVSRNSLGLFSPTIQMQQESVYRSEVRVGTGDAITEALASQVIRRLLNRFKTLSIEKGIVVGLDLDLDATLAMALKQMKPYIGRVLLSREHAKVLKKGDIDFIPLQVVGNLSTYRTASAPNAILPIISSDEKIAAGVSKRSSLYGIVVHGETPKDGRIYYDWVEKVTQLVLALIVTRHVQNVEVLQDPGTFQKIQNEIVSEFFLPVEVGGNQIILDRARFRRWILDQLLLKGKINVGGKHGDTKQFSELGKVESHHVPGSNSYPTDYYNETLDRILNRDDKSALTLTRAHHLETISWGASSAARDFRKKQKRYIENGEFWEALAMDIQNIQHITAREGEPNKYSLALKQVIDYCYRIQELKQKQKLMLEELL